LKKSNSQKRNLQKTSKFQLKQAQKQSTRNSTKKQAQIRGKTARLATLERTPAGVFMNIQNMSGACTTRNKFLTSLHERG